MAVRHADGRPVDVGVAHLTARDPIFRAVVEDRCDRGLARPWTNTFAVYEPQGWSGEDAGPLRYAAKVGLRSLVEDLAAGLDVEQGREVSMVGLGPVVDGERAAAVVLDMPDPQALDLLAETQSEEVEVCAGRHWDPVLTLYAAWSTRCWEDFGGAFINGHAVLAFVADDGARRGDGSPLLVAHSTAQFAAPRLDDPDVALPDLVAAVTDLLQLGREPAWAHVKRLGAVLAEQPCPRGVGQRRLRTERGEGDLLAVAKVLDRRVTADPDAAPAPDEEGKRREVRMHSGRRGFHRANGGQAARQYAPRRDTTAKTVFHRIDRSNAGDQFST